MKCCIKCSIEKDDVHFRSGRNICKLCHKKQRKLWRQNNKQEIKKYLQQYRQDNKQSIREKTKQYRRNNLKKSMLAGARKRSKLKNIAFDINEEDIIIPLICPVLGIPLESGIGKGVIQPNSPSLDRIVPEKGYIKGNIIVVSNKANTMKSDATPEEIIAVGEFYKKLLEEANKK